MNFTNAVSGEVQSQVLQKYSSIISINSIDFLIADDQKGVERHRGVGQLAPDVSLVAEIEPHRAKFSDHPGPVLRDHGTRLTQVHPVGASAVSRPRRPRLQGVQEAQPHPGVQGVGSAVTLHAIAAGCAQPKLVSTTH